MSICPHGIDSENDCMRSFRPSKVVLRNSVREKVILLHVFFFLFDFSANLLFIEWSYIDCFSLNINLFLLIIIFAPM